MESEFSAKDRKDKCGAEVMSWQSSEQLSSTSELSSDFHCA